MEQRQIKVIMVGDAYTGKTALIKQYVHGVFSTAHQGSTGVHCVLKVLPWSDSCEVRLQIWDIHGYALRFSMNMTRLYYREAAAAFVVLDSTRPSSLYSALEWKRDLDAKIQMPDGSPIPVILIMNKCDQLRHPEITDTRALCAFAAEHGFTDFYETTACDSEHQVLSSYIGVFTFCIVWPC
jgi:Ras-related protein Rab-32